MVCMVSRKASVLINARRMTPHCRSEPQKALKKCSFIEGEVPIVFLFLNKNCMYLSCTLFDLHLYSKMITNVKPISLSVS